MKSILTIVSILSLFFIACKKEVTKDANSAQAIRNEVESDSKGSGSGGRNNSGLLQSVLSGSTSR